MKPFCVIIRGPPAVGKSTIAKRLATAIPNTVHLDVDLLKHMISSRSSVPRTEIAHDVARHFLKQLMKHRYNIVIEEMFREQHLTPILRLLKKSGYRTTRIFLTSPASIALSRDNAREKNKGKKVILRFHNEVGAMNDDTIIDTGKNSIAQSVAAIKRVLKR